MLFTSNRKKMFISDGTTNDITKLYKTDLE